MTKHRRWAAISAVVAIWASAQAADLEQGRARSFACQACHGSSGISHSADIPNLAGQKTEYLATQLAAFRAGERKQELMNAIAAQLDDADIANLAAFWSSLPASGDASADAAAALRKSRMTFPANFPRGFVMYAEEVEPADKSVKRSYANRVAIAAARAGQPLPTGSAIVVANYSAGREQPDSYAAMESQAGWGADLPALLRNGEWSYALFDARRTLRASFNYARCLACHKPRESSSYVFGLARLAEAPLPK